MSDTPHPNRFVAREDFGQLFQLLVERGYTVVGPTIDQGAIVYDELDSVDSLPRGWTDQQAPGSYRLQRREDEALFGYAVGPHSWKQFLFPPRTTLSTAERTGDQWQFSTAEDDAPRYAFLGVRACELAAIEVQDRVFISDAYADPVYEQRRRTSLIIAVNCAEAASTCFCTSMNTGPRCQSGYDIVLTELADGFLVECGSEAGQEIVEAWNTSSATSEHVAAATESSQRCADQIERRMDTTDLRNLLLDNLEHSRWDEVASRCLSCTNCTMVCPTCFCSSVHDVTDLEETHVERQRQWDSCFNVDFSYMNGGEVRNSIRSRYRQWLTHKLASWIDQFGTSGCVGCGRCITWCPVGIDLTEEVAAIRGEGP